MHPPSDASGISSGSGGHDAVVITAKRLDSDDVQEVVLEVEMPATEAAQRAQLVDLVKPRFPDAELRSFADEAASFLAPKLLVVAVYRRTPGSTLAPAEPDDPEVQQQLFAA